MFGHVANVNFPPESHTYNCAFWSLVLVFLLFSSYSYYIPFIYCRLGVNIHQKLEEKLLWG